MENIWKTHGNHIENIWKTHGKHMENTWKTYGKRTTMNKMGHDGKDKT